MSYFIDFGRFSEMTEEKIKRDKEILIMYFANMCVILSFPLDIDAIENKEIYLNNLLEKGRNRVDFSFFMNPLGISYDYLDKEEKEEIKNLYISYENVKNFTLNYQKKYIEKCKKCLPSEIRECFKDICFIIYCHMYGNPKIDIKIFIRNIRDYFILDKEKNVFEKIRKKALFDEIRSNMLIKYPQLKKEYYGMNPTIEKLLSYIDRDNDYNYKILRDILDKKKENDDEEKIKLKEKID